MGSWSSWVDFCLMALTLISVMVLVICGVIVVREYHLAREFLPTQCSVSHVEATADVECSHCSTTTTTTFRNGKRESRSSTRCRKSSYPCVMVHVVYDYSGTDTQNGVLHSTVVQLADNNKCSYSVCQALPSENAKLVWQFVKPWQYMPVNDTAPCFYNPARPVEVIAAKQYSRASAIHSMVWPCLFLVIAGLVLLYRLTTCHRSRSRNSPRYFTTPSRFGITPTTASRWRSAPHTATGAASRTESEPTGAASRTASEPNTTIPSAPPADLHPHQDAPEHPENLPAPPEPTQPDPFDPAPAYAHLAPSEVAPPTYEDAVKGDMSSARS